MLFDATLDRAAAMALLDLMMHRRRLKGTHGELSRLVDVRLDDMVDESLRR